MDLEGIAYAIIHGFLFVGFFVYVNKKFGKGTEPPVFGLSPSTAKVWGEEVRKEIRTATRLVKEPLLVVLLCDIVLSLYVMVAAFRFEMGMAWVYAAAFGFIGAAALALFCYRRTENQDRKIFISLLYSVILGAFLVPAVLLFAYMILTGELR